MYVASSAYSVRSKNSSALPTVAAAIARFVAVVVCVIAVDVAGRERITLAELCAHPLGLGSAGTSQRELFDIGAQLEGLTVRPALVCDSLGPQYEFVRAGGGLALVGDLGDIGQDTSTEGVAYVPVDHPVFRQREAQVQTATGRRPSWPAAQFTELLVEALRRDRSP